MKNNSTPKETRSIIDTYFSTRTKDLEEYFNKFCSDKEKGYFPNMLSEMYMHVIEKIDKLEELIHREELHFYCIQYIYNQRNWQGTKFKAEITIKETNEQILTSHETNEKLQAKMIDLCVENDFDLDEYHVAVSNKHDSRLKQVQAGIDKMTNSQKALYNKYFIEKQSMRKIAKEVGVSSTAIFNLIKEVKSIITSQ